MSFFKANIIAPPFRLHPAAKYAKNATLIVDNNDFSGGYAKFWIQIDVQLSTLIDYSGQTVCLAQTYPWFLEDLIEKKDPLSSIIERRSESGIVGQRINR